MAQATAKRPCLLWIVLGASFLFLGLAGMGLARWIERTAWLHQDQRHRLVAPIERQEAA